MTVKFFAMWVVFVAGLALAAYRARPYFKPLLAAPAANRWDRPGERLAGVLADLGLHRRLLKFHYSGVLHAMIFAGFLVLFSAIVQSFGSGLIPGFSLRAIGGDSWIAFLQDVFALVVVAGLALAAWQRWFIRPQALSGLEHDGCVDHLLSRPDGRGDHVAGVLLSPRSRGASSRLGDRSARR